MADYFLGDTTQYTALTGADYAAADRFPVIDASAGGTYGVLKQITKTELLTVFQASDATLTAFAVLTIAANSLTLGTGADAFSQTTFAANTFPARASTGNLEAKAITDFGLSLVDDIDASTARTTLGLGTLAIQSGTFSGTSSGTNTGDQNLFSTVAVAGQSNVVADATSDTLTLVAGSNITITTDASTDTITIAASGGGTPGGADTQVQFNDVAAFGGDAGLTFNKTTNSLTVTGNHFVGSGTMSVGTSGVGVIVAGNSTVPTTYPADEAQMWCADISAANAAWHLAGEGLVAVVTVGGVTIRQKGGTPGTNELQIWHDGTDVQLRNPAGTSSFNSLSIGASGSQMYVKVTGVVESTIGVNAAQYFAVTAFGAYLGHSSARWIIQSGYMTSTGWVQLTAGRSSVASDVTNATTTMANVTGLSATLIAGRKYAGRLVLYVNDSVASEGVKVDFDGGTATMTSFRAHATIYDATLLLSTQTTALATDIAVATITGDSLIEVELGFVCNVAGTFVPRFAQNSHISGTATVYANSFLLLEDVP